ncbi:MAG: hypothetical protein KAG97_00640, partial [Victivallales bacterium]|nr:hypothetical protein [Victivallales bacterium]
MTTSKKKLFEVIRKHARGIIPHIREDGADVWAAQWLEDENTHPTSALQWIHSAFLQVAFGLDEGSSERAEFYRAGIANLKYSISIIDENGLIPLWSFGNYSRMFRAEWHFYALLCSLNRLLRYEPANELIPGIEKILLDYGAAVFAALEDPANRLTSKANCNNHQMWELALLHRLGSRFSRREWRDLADKVYLEEIIPAQTSDGNWNEFGFPTTLYHNISQMALGVYSLSSGSAEAKEAAAKALEFSMNWSYPNHRGIETVDARVVYREKAPAMVDPSWPSLPGGPAYFNDRLAVIDGELSASSRDLPDNLGWLAFAFDSLTDEECSQPCEIGDRMTLKENLAAQLRKNKWTAVVSGMRRPSEQGHYAHDLSQYFSLFHQNFGLICGGGNSRRDAYFGTFYNAGGTGAYMATGCRDITASENGVEVTMEFNEDLLKVALEIKNANLAEIVFTWLTPRENDFWEASFLVPSPPGDTWVTGDGESITVSENERINRNSFCVPDNPTLVLNDNITFTFDAIDSSVRWPLLHYNPYTLYPYEVLERSHARIAVKLDSRQPSATIGVEMRLISSS